MFRLTPAESLSRHSGFAGRSGTHGARPSNCFFLSVAFQHFEAELSVFFGNLRRAGVMRGDAAVFRREAEGHGDFEISERFHLAIEPGEGVGAIEIGPT